jgi:hypothetical protein
MWRLRGRASLWTTWTTPASEQAPLSGSSLGYTFWRGRIGFDTKILRKVISIRKLEDAERQEQESLLELYLSALGMAPQPVE